MGVKAAIDWAVWLSVRGQSALGVRSIERRRERNRDRYQHHTPSQRMWHIRS